MKAFIDYLSEITNSQYYISVIQDNSIRVDPSIVFPEDPLLDDFSVILFKVDKYNLNKRFWFVTSEYIIGWLVRIKYTWRFY